LTRLSSSADRSIIPGIIFIVSVRALHLQDSRQLLHRNFAAVLNAPHPFKRLEPPEALPSLACAFGLAQWALAPARLIGRRCPR
jgi:hypothetical protein